MQEELIRALRSRRAQIRTRWEAFLRVEPVPSPLGNPDTLAFGIDDSLTEIFQLLRQPPGESPWPPPHCTCGQNPLQAFYLAGEQALLETLILVQAGFVGLEPAARDQSFASLRHAIRHIAHREISVMAGLCQKHPETT